MRRCYCLFLFLFLNIVNIFGEKISNEYVFMKKLRPNSSPLYFKNAVDQSKNQNIDGGIIEVDPNDVKYYELATKSLQKYAEGVGSKNHHVTKVTKATEQVVSGLMTRIDFEAALTHDELDELNQVNVNHINIVTCHAEIWDQPWINCKTIEVDCWH